MADDRFHIRRAVIQIPTGTVGATRRHVNKGQIRFRQIRRNLRVHQRHFARQRFKGRIQLTRQHADILRTGGDAEVIAPCETDQITIALHHRIEQFVVRLAHFINFPVRPVVEHHQTLFIPAPRVDQLADDFATPADAGALAAEFFAHFQVEAAAHQVETSFIFNGLQVGGHALQHHAVGVESEGDDLAVVQALFDIFRQQAVVGVFPGVGFQQQRFQHRFIGRVDTLIQLPQAGAEVLFRRQ